MIGYFLEASLSTRNFLEFPFGRFRLLLLQVLSAMLKLTTIDFDSRTAKAAPVTKSVGNMHDPQIHAKNPVNVHRCGSSHSTNREQIEFAFHKAQITFPALSEFNKFYLAFTTGKRDGCPTRNRPDGEHSVSMCHVRMRLSKAIAPCGLKVRFVLRSSL